MIKTTLIASTLLLGLSLAVSAQKGKQKNAKSEVKFLNEIEIEIAPSSVEERSKLSEFEAQYFAKKETPATTIISSHETLIESVNSLQIKYALLLDTEIEQVKNVSLYSHIDEWYGTRYRLGGTTKKGIDCSAFVQTLYSSQYGINLPRTAREQYDATTKISRTDLKEGDLVFFNTTGGVSHVGIYLQNNKFVHAGSSDGVMISDLFDSYWERRFIGVSRYTRETESLTLVSNP